MKKDDKNLKFYLVILWVFAFLVIIKMLTLTVNAEEPYFPMHQNANGLVPRECQDVIGTFFASENNNIFIEYWAHNSSYYKYYVCIFPKDSNGNIYAEVLSNGYQFSLYNFNNVPIYCYEVYVYLSDYHIEPYQITFSTFQNLQSSNYSDGWDYASNFQVYSNNNEDEIILLYGSSDPVINTGVAVIPPTAFIPEYLTGDTPPQNVPPEYTVNNYTWTTAPQFDGSTVINGIQSIKNTLEWLSSNLHEELANLLNNIKGLATYIGKTIQYYGNAIIETMNNAIQNLYENFVALLEPIVQKVNEISEKITEIADLFIHPFDEEEFAEQMESCELINQYEELMDNCDVLKTVFANAQERDSFIIYIDFENPFADSEHKIIHGQISFNWLVPLRTVYRPFLWVCVLFECFVGGFRILGNIIGGKAK